jgi:hypothetical protein
MTGRRAMTDPDMRHDRPGYDGEGLQRRSLPRRAFWVILHLAITAAFARLLVAPVVYRAEAGATDFTVFYTGWSLALHDPAHIYDVEAQRRVQADILRDRHFKGGVMTFYYPPHAAIAFAPLALLDFHDAFRVWMLLQLAAAALLVRWLLQLSGLEGKLDRWVLGTAVLAFLPLLYALQIGQLSIAMTVALIGFWRAFDRRRDAEAGAWLLALTVKAQLLPVPCLVLLAARRLRPVGWMAIWAAPIVALATAVLGVGAWRAYPEAVRHLEGFVAGGSHDHMLNLRGLLSRLFGLDHDRAIVAVCTAAFAATTFVAYVWLRRQARRGPIPLTAFAAALALELPTSLHLHLQDVLVWTIPLVVFSTRSGAAAAWSRRFAPFALAWPLAFVVAYATEAASGHLLPIPVPLALAAVAIAWISRDPAIRGAR